MKNLIPEFQTKKEAFAYLRTNKGKLIAQKKALPTTSDDLEFGYSKATPTKSFSTKKEKANPVEDDEDDALQVDVIANMSGWCDSQMDVMIKDSWKKSITDLSASGQKLIYHLKNHDYTIDAIIGKDPSLYSKDIDLSMFNITTDIKKAQGLLMTSLVMESYDEKVFNLYNDGQVKQHSIGLQYIQLLLCLDSTEEEDQLEKKNWDKYYPIVINKEKVDNYGYFWAVIEAKILEVSAVLYGANILTPVLTGKIKMSMEETTNDNKNIEFIDKMIPHHELAITMVNDYQSSVDNTELLSIMSNIRTTQNDQINKMKEIRSEEESKSQIVYTGNGTDAEPPKGTMRYQPHKTLSDSNKSIIGCPACDYLFVRPEGDKINCPNCGQYVSPNSTTIMLSEEPFDWKKAIEETQFI